MKLTFTDKLLLFLADLEDFRRASFSVNSGLLYCAGHPALHKSHSGMVRYLQDKRKRRKFYNTLYRLVKQNILYIKYKGNKFGYLLTQEGNLGVLGLRAKNLKNLRKKKLPGRKWLMVFFDIPEKDRKIRDCFRDILKYLGFNQLQKSIWISQNDVIKDVKKAIEGYRIKNYVHIMVVEKIDTQSFI